MKKLLLLNIISLLILVNIAYATGVVDITAVNSPSGNPSDTVQINITVDNADTSTSTISTVNLASSDLVSGSNTITAPSISSITNLVNSTPQTVSVSLTIPSTPSGIYSGTINATESGNTSNSDTFSYSVTVNSVDRLDVTTSSLTLTGQEGDSVSSTFTISNTGSTTLTSFTLVTTVDPSFDLNDSDGDTITLSTSFPSSIAPGASGTATLTAALGNNIDLDTYGGNVNVTSGSATDTFELEIRVQPEVCEDGIRRDGDLVSTNQANLDVDIENPDNNDEFAPGETIDIEVRVRNNNDDEMDVVVEAFLYNIDEDDEIDRVKSDSIEIGDGDSETFDLEIKVPEEDLDDEDDYILFVKAFEDGQEDENCNENSVNIDIEKEDHMVIIDELTVSPSTVSCGELINIAVNVLNIGKRDENDVFVEAKEPLLGLNERSAEFDLDDGDDAVERFSFTIPKDAKEQTYNIEAIVTFDDGDKTNSEFTTLTVSGCGLVETITIETAADLGINEADIVVEKNAFSIPVQVTNNANRLVTYDIEIVNIDWAEPISAKTLTLNPGQKSTIFLFLQPKGSIVGKQSATVNLKSNGEVINSKTLTFDIKEEEKTKLLNIADLFKGRTSTVLFIVVDVILIVLAILLIKMLIIPRKR